MKVNPPISILSKVMGLGMLWGKPLVDSAIAHSTQPFQQHNIILPRLNEKYYSWTQYSIFFPDLDEPFRYLNIVILLGTPGALAFDSDNEEHQSPREQASVFSSTANIAQPLLKAYVIPEETHIQNDGHLLQFGKEITISGALPHIEVYGEYEELKFHFFLHISDQVSWYIKTPVYDHFSLLSQYHGRIEYQKQCIEQKGLCSYEYARAVGIHSLIQTRISDQYKIPIDFFTHHIINIDDQTQIVLIQANLINTPAMICMYVRRLHQDNEVYQHVNFKVIAHHLDDYSSPKGEKMRLPKNFSWQAFDQNGNEFFEIFATADAPFHFGRGRGYVNSFQYNGHFNQQPILGRGYMEYINVEDQKSFIDDPNELVETEA
ncbi:DUF6670 family protein [Acinetobacter rudis]|uniref:Uncharacterized protein n=1 Tax=Acinetobacter rudis TaxID=632955 RepID=A0AAW8J490_9GAMM|nr:DUF6670 family protein [Acinetobacter rudis]MDQ8934505.1 hypothetical protein [Acinetobacter rudis]MDQ8951801.1 hypothetical protein [Acinetobacter rudis]MDQ9016595.1 hypothetical protein [Acinetobacter rudis]